MDRLLFNQIIFYQNLAIFTLSYHAMFAMLLLLKHKVLFTMLDC